MRTVTRIIFVVVLAWSFAACVGPASPSPVDSAPAGPVSGRPAIPSPGTSFEPEQPDHTIEVPPPID